MLEWGKWLYNEVLQGFYSATQLTRNSAELDPWRLVHTYTAESTLKITTSAFLLPSSNPRKRIDSVHHENLEREM